MTPLARLLVWIRMPRRKRMKILIATAVKMQRSAESWSMLAAVTEDADLLYTFRYRAAAARQMSELADKAWMAEAMRQPDRARELRDQIKAVNLRTKERLGSDNTDVVVS